ncbi:MAG: hypothetical protein ACI381_06165 [Candidatus Methanomethylophilaceae archaeon]
MKAICNNCKHCRRRECKKMDDNGLIRDAYIFDCKAKHVVLDLSIYDPHPCSLFEEIEEEDMEKTFEVILMASATCTVFVKAEDSFDAEEKAMMMDIDSDEWEIDEITIEGNECVDEGAFKRKLREVPVEERTLHKDQTKLF